VLLRSLLLLLHGGVPGLLPLPFYSAFLLTAVPTVPVLPSIPLRAEA